MKRVVCLVCGLAAAMAAAGGAEGQPPVFRGGIDLICQIAETEATIRSPDMG